MPASETKVSPAGNVASCIWRWVQAYAPELNKRCRPHLKPTNKSYRIDETYIKVKGEDKYLYRALDSTGQTIDFLLTAKRDTAAAKRFLRRAIDASGNPMPRVMNVDKNPGMKHLPGPGFIAEDIHMMIRQAIATYNLLFYLNADERREQDCYWNNNYGVVTAPLVRSMIDCLYNITLILENPAENGIAYHKSGIKKRLLDIEEDQKTYAGKPEWDSYNAQQLRPSLADPWQWLHRGRNP